MRKHKGLFIPWPWETQGFEQSKRILHCEIDAECCEVCAPVPVLFKGVRSTYTGDHHSPRHWNAWSLGFLIDYRPVPGESETKIFRWSPPWKIEGGPIVMNPEVKCAP